MGLLLDTHVLLWLYQNPARISSAVLDAIDRNRDIAVSVVSGWEYELKRLKHGGWVSFSELIAGSGFSPQELPFACHPFARSLPPLHSDPFDRMLIAHALVAGMTLVTSDRTLHRYPVETLW